MKISNIIGFLKWHVNTYKFNVFHLYILIILYSIGNLAFVDPHSIWFKINAYIGGIPFVITVVEILIIDPIKTSYKKYQESKLNLLKTIDNGD